MIAARWRILVFAVLVGYGGGSATGQPNPPKVILFSWDGAAYWATSHLLSEGHLPNLQRLVGEGAWSDGMITSFPSKTAAGHAMLWTGHFGHTSGITGNSLLLEPALEHSRLESQTGFFSTGLNREPIWIMTARAGLDTYTFHATQSYPFGRQLELLTPAHRQNLHMLYGYTRNTVPAELYTSESTPARPSSGWAIPEVRGQEAREFRIEAGEESFWAVFFDDPFDTAEGCDTLGVVREKRDTSFLALIKPGDGFSIPIETSSRGQSMWFSLRVFELDPSASRFLVYRCSAEAVEMSRADDPDAGDLGTRFFAGNGGSSSYREGGFGTKLTDGGEGEAEDRFVETLAHVTGQLQKQVEKVLERGEFELLIMYSPVPDEVAHVFTGYLDPAVPGYDETLADRLWPVMARAFETQDELLGWVMDRASRVGAHVLLVSDHGMAGTHRLLNVNVALERDGLLALTPERKIDLSRTRALLLPLSDASVAVNTVDRKGGIVPMDEKEIVLEQVRKVLEKVNDPETGHPVVKGFFRSSRQGLLQPGGKTTGDVFLDLIPGYYFSSSTEKDELTTVTAPVGNHIFLPTRRDMLAIFGAWGPRFRGGVRLPRVQAIDVVPTTLDLLGLEIPGDLPGRSLLPAKALIDREDR